MSVGMGAAPTLEARGVSVRFGGLAALTDIDLTLPRSHIIGLIGPNGAGKTTLVNVLSGYQRPDNGEVLVGTERLSGLPPHRFARRGIARTFQAVRLFGGMTVLENVQVAAIASGMSLPRARERSEQILAWIGCKEEIGRLCSELPYGRERLVGIARGLATSPDFLLLDEPAAGLNETEALTLAASITEIPREFGCGVLLIEHNVGLVRQVSARIHVLEVGRTLAIGAPDEIVRHPEVRRAYLGDP
jgi:branched-chain amino acid transport system ATP-binding protein